MLNGEACLWLADMSAFTPAPAFPTVNETTSRLRSEQFLQFVAVQLADYPVLVVSELTLADQDYIWNFVEKMLVPNRPSAITLIVVHNLKDMKSIDEVELKIQNDIVHCMGATKVKGPPSGRPARCPASAVHRDVFSVIIVSVASQCCI